MIKFQSKRTDRWDAKKTSGVAFAEDASSNSSGSGRSNTQKDNNYFQDIDQLREERKKLDFDKEEDDKRRRRQSYFIDQSQLEYAQQFMNKGTKREVKGALTNIISVDNANLNLVKYEDGLAQDKQ